MTRGSAETAPHALKLEALGQYVGKQLRLGVRQASFVAPDYAGAIDFVEGRLWAYDAASDTVVLETGNVNALPPYMRRVAASAVYDVEGANASRPAQASSGVATGFKLLKGSNISHIEQLSESDAEATRRAASGSTFAAPSELAPAYEVPSNVVEAREAAAVKRSLDKAQRTGSKEVSDTGQTIFDALSKTYVTACRSLLTHSLPCRWHDTHIIVLDEVIVVRRCDLSGADSAVRSRLR